MTGVPGEGLREVRGRPRVAVVIPKYGLVGGGERFAAELTERLAAKERHEFHVFANRWESRSPGIAFHKVPIIRFPRTLRPLSFAWFADGMIGRGKFDIVHSHERVFRADVISLHSVPHAGWVRDIRRKRASLFDRATVALERRMMTNVRTSRILPVSSIAAEALLREYAVDPARLRVVHPGVDFGRFSAPDRAACRAEVRPLHGIGPADILILFVGMNFEVKGLGRAIAAVGTARRARPDAAIRLLVVGRGDVRKYRGLAREQGIGDSVFFSGPLSAGVERYYRAADAFIMLSDFDTFGMAVLEAMAAGIPVIVSPNVGAKDVVVDGRNGFVVGAAETGPSAAERIALLLEEGERTRMGREASSTASRLTWEAAAAQVEGIYGEVLAGR